MKWKWLGLAAVCGLVLAGASMSLRAERKEKPVRNLVPEPIAAVPSATVPSAEPPHAKTSKDQAAGELVAIIKETESPETFALALQALALMKPKDKTILPLALRQAERLGLMEGMLGENLTAPQETLLGVFEILFGDELTNNPNNVVRTSRNANSRSCPPNCVPVSPPSLCHPAVPSVAIPAANPPMGPVAPYSMSN